MKKFDYFLKFFNLFNLIHCDCTIFDAKVLGDGVFDAYFESIDAARKWVKGFVEWYNNEHYHSGLNFVTPNARHNGTADKIMEKRKKVYKAAREVHPERWTRETRNWKLPETVALNPTEEIKEITPKHDSSA